ncbi:MAG: hypothetical protein RPU34_04040 [Candidatus Sedimenticola sp. (ex Thyasira tokunagai)]
MKLVIFFTLGLSLLVIYLLVKIIKRGSSKKGNEIPGYQPEATDETVRCFTCGMDTPIETALEKKGRYFCGVKKHDRENQAEAGEKESSTRSRGE